MRHVRDTLATSLHSRLQEMGYHWQLGFSRWRGGAHEAALAAFCMGAEPLWDQCTWPHTAAEREAFDSIAPTTASVLGLLVDTVRQEGTAPRDD